MGLGYFVETRIFNNDTQLPFLHLVFGQITIKHHKQHLLVCVKKNLKIKFVLDKNE